MHDHTFASKSPDQTAGHTLSGLSVWQMHKATLLVRHRHTFQCVFLLFFKLIHASNEGK